MSWGVASRGEKVAKTATSKKKGLATYFTDAEWRNDTDTST